MKRPEDNPQGIPGQNPGYSPTPPFEGPYAVNMPPSWPGPQGQMGGYPPPYHGFYQMPYGIPPQPWQTPPAGAPQDAVAAQAGLSAALGDMAEKNGLGMFKDFLNFEDGDFWKGAVVGAAVVLLLTNENLRNSLIGGAAKAAEALKTGFSADGDQQTTADEETEDQPEENGA